MLVGVEATTPTDVAAGATPAPATRRQVLGLALPAMAALAADPLLGLVDTALVGRLGTPALAALGIDVAIFSTVFFASNVLAYGTTAEVARLRGAGRDAEAADRALQALWLAVAIGAVVSVGLLVAARPVVGLMGASGEVVEPALQYLRIRALAAVPVLVVLVGHGTFRGLRDTATPMRIALAANVVNAGLSWALIGPAGLGVAGAAWGTVVAQVGAAAAFLVVARRRLPVPALRVEPHGLRAVLRTSRDLFLRTLALVLGLATVTAVGARMGTAVVAAHQVARELWLLLALVLDGFAIAGQALVGTALGAGRGDVARADARSLVLWGVAIGVAVGVLFLALAGPLPRLFTDDPEVLAGVRSVWWIVAVLQPLGGLVFVLDGVLMGAGDFRFLFVSTAGVVLVVLLPAAFLALAVDAGLLGLWVAMGAMVFARAVVLVVRARGARWSR